MPDTSNIRAIRPEAQEISSEKEVISKHDSNADSSLMNDPKVTELVYKVWSTVFGASNEVLLHADKYGYHGMTIVPNPNIHEILEQIKVMSVHLNNLSLLVNGSFDYEQNRLLLNAREQMMRMERLALALTNDKREDFDEQLALMKSQGVF
jgi:hypothetical protein